MTTYAVPWYTCSLNCPHCLVKTRQVRGNFEQFLNSLSECNDDHVVLFGGEPTLYWDKFVKVVETDKIDSISTNLLISELHCKELAYLLHEYNMTLATSWNFTRFTSEQYDLWLSNLNLLADRDLDVLVLITLTEDLINSDMSVLIKSLKDMEKAGVTKFEFEPYIGISECNDKADKFLCEFHNRYKGSMTNVLEQSLGNWNCSCIDTKTLEPDGEVRNGCPDLIIRGVSSYCADCLTCENSSFCTPCKLQKSCSYPKELKKLLGVGNG